MRDLLDRLACRLGIWSLRRIFGANCRTDVHDDWPDEPGLYCPSCDAKRLVRIMEDVLLED